MRLLVLFMVVGLPLSARAGVDSNQVKAGVAAYEDLEYDKAINLLRKALAAESLTRDERIITHRTLAFTHVALGDEAAAREQFKTLLRFDPTVTLDRTISPRVRKVFDEAKAQIPRSELVVAPAPVAQPEHKPIYKKAWFWATLGGVVVAGAVIGIAVGVTSSGPGPDTPASLTIQLH